MIELHLPGRLRLGQAFTACVAEIPCEFGSVDDYTSRGVLAEASVADSLGAARGAP